MTDPFSMPFECQRSSHSGYDFGLTQGLAAAPRENLVELVKNCLSTGSGVLGGRGVFGDGKVPGVGRVFVKQYTRGGAFGWINSRNYLRCGKTRGERECQALATVRKMGIPAPEPLGFAVRGSLLCQAWLFASFIEDTVSLAELSVQDEARTHDALTQLVENVSILVKHSVQHVDLHPGNVLVGTSGKVYLLDFDKAASFSGTSAELRDFYLRRWRRAVLKHQLPDYLTELVSLGLRRHAEGERATYC